MSIKNVKAAMPIIEQDAQQQDPALSVKSDVGLAAPVESSSSTVGLSRCDADNDISLEAGLLGAGNVSEALQVRPRPRMACVSITPGARDAGAEGEGEGEAGLSGAGAGSASASAEADGDGVDDAAGTASAVRAIDDEHEQRLVTDVGALDALTRTITSTVTGRKTKTEEEQEQEQEQEQKIMVTNASEAEGYAHACQAVFAGYIAVAHRQNVHFTLTLPGPLSYPHPLFPSSSPPLLPSSRPVLFRRAASSQYPLALILSLVFEPQHIREGNGAGADSVMY